MTDQSRSVPWYRSLRFKLVATAITVELVMLGALLTNSFYLLNNEVNSQTQARLEAFTPLLDAALAGRVFQRDHAEVTAILNRLTSTQRTEISYITVLDPAGKTIASSGNLGTETMPGEDHSVAEALTDLTYDVRLPLTIIGNEVGTVRFGLSLAALVDTQRRVVREGGIIAAIEILLSLLILATGGYLLTRHIRALTDGTRRVAQGDYSAQIIIPGHDEISMLASDFNNMAAAVAVHVNELRASEMRFAAIFNAVGEAIFVFDSVTSKIIDVNQRMCQMYGYTREEVIGSDSGTFSSGVHPYTVNEAIAKIRAAKAGAPQVFDWHARAKDGHLFWVEVSLRLSRIGDDDRLIAVVRDMSERKKAENDLAAEKEQLAVTLRSIGDGVITTDTRGGIVLLNTVAETLTGWSQQEAQGRPLTEVCNIIHEKTRKPCDNPVEKVLASGEIMGLANHTTLIARDGRERQIADSAAPIRDREGRIIGVVLVFRDVTEKQRTEEELMKVKKLESVGVLAGGIAHDFNNILVAILGNINLALLDGNLEEKTRQLLSEAEKASIRAKGLTQQLLTFSKGGEPVKQTTSIAEIIKDSADFVLHGSNVACRYSLPDDLWLVDIDKGQMSQVIQNIIINAKHAMPDGGTIRVNGKNIESLITPDTSLPIKDKYIKIDISDSGSGIPDNLLDKIFDPYFTTKEEGSGLGLAITHSIISKHAGYISVQSKPGAGTTFTLYLPVSTREQKKENGKATMETRAASAKIMIMDDEEMVRDVAKAIFVMLGHEVFLAADGEEAVELYKKQRELGQPIDIIIMDLTIPGGMGGEKAVQEILAINPEAKVIVSSGYSNDPVMAHYQDHGFIAAIVKPFHIQDIVNIINKLLT
jgi:PAS domain S-box-containing protein